MTSAGIFSDELEVADGTARCAQVRQRHLGILARQQHAVRAAVRAALNAGAHGVLLSRKYSEMRLANLRAAGEGLQGS